MGLDIGPIIVNLSFWFIMKKIFSQQVSFIDISIRQPKRAVMLFVMIWFPEMFRHLALAGIQMIFLACRMANFRVTSEANGTSTRG